VLKIDRGHFEDIMRANPAAALGVINVLTRRLRILSDLTPGLSAEQLAVRAHNETQ